MRSNEELLIAAYKAFNLRDIDAALHTMHDDVDWPNGMEGGRVHGRGGVRDYWTRQWKLLDPHVEPLSFEAGEPGQTVVHVHQIVKDLDGKVLLDQMIDHLYFIEGSLIRKMEIRESGLQQGKS
jgi:SnoaL-like domain